MKRLEGKWPEHVRAWRKSGETGRAYCAKRGLNLHTLWSWSARMQDEKRAMTTASKVSTEVRMARVVPAPRVEVAALVDDGTGVALRVGRVHIEVERGFDGETLSRVLSVLERRGAGR